MTLRVALVGPECGNMTRCILRVMGELGCSARAFIYHVPQANSPVQRVLDRMADPGLKRRAAQAFNAQLCAALDTRPEYLLVLKGEALEDATRRCLDKARVPIVAWAFDSMSRCPDQAAIWPWAQASFVIDGGDTNHLNRKSIWLPLGYDEMLYTPSDRKDLDILLIGRLGQRYSTRRKHLLTLAQSDLARRYRIGFVGGCENRISNLKLIKARQNLQWIAAYMSETELGRCIAQSRLCINILQDDGVQPINPVFFAISGARTCQVTLHREYLGEWMRPGIDFVGFPDGNFKEYLDALLEDPKRIADVSRSGWESAMSAHTYKHRLRFILSELGCCDADSVEMQVPDGFRN